MYNSTCHCGEYGLVFSNGPDDYGILDCAWVCSGKGGDYSRSTKMCLAAAAAVYPRSLGKLGVLQWQRTRDEEAPYTLP